jgi:hypothetical protein
MEIRIILPHSPIKELVRQRLGRREKEDKPSGLGRLMRSMMRRKMTDESEVEKD